jgi:hypothetical protein
MRLYRPFSLAMLAVFPLVGILFLTGPAGVLGFFNSLSSGLGLLPTPTQVSYFYLGLAVAYMALVSTLAFLMYRQPANHYFPLLLAVGKLSSSALSLGLFLFAQRSLACIANFAIDGAIGTAALLFAVGIRRSSR